LGFNLRTMGISSGKSCRILMGLNLKELR
jgi:hypothetical protein